MFTITVTILLGFRSVGNLEYVRKIKIPVYLEKELLWNSASNLVILVLTLQVYTDLPKSKEIL